MLEIVYTVFQHFLHAFLCEKRQMKRVEHDHDAKTLRSQRFGITRAQNTTRILLEYYTTRILLEYYTTRILENVRKQRKVHAKKY